MDRPEARRAAAISLWSGGAVIAVAMALRTAIPGTSPWFVLWLAIGVSCSTFLTSYRMLVEAQNPQSAPESQ